MAGCRQRCTVCATLPRPLRRPSSTRTRTTGSSRSRAIPTTSSRRAVTCGSGMSEREIHNNLEGRLLYPMKRVDWDPKGERNPENRGKSAFERISWDEAMDIIADECLRIKEAYGPEAIITGQGTGRVANHWHCRINSSLGLEGWSLVPTHVCLMPHILPNAFTLGVFSSAAGDMRNAHCAVLWGQNPAMETAWCKEVFKNQAAGITKLIVIDVRFQDMSKHADVALQPRPGTDAALALAFMHEIIEHGWYDPEFIENWTYGFDELAERVKDWTPERAAEICQVDADDIRLAAEYMGNWGPVGMCIGLGPGCMHTNAIQNGRAIACLQGMLGYLDVKGGIPVPLSFSVMLDDKITLWDSQKDPGRPELFTFGGEEHPLYKSFGRSNDPHAVFNAIITGEPRPVKAYIAIANDPLLCYENTNLTYQAMTSPNLDFVCVKDFYMSPTAKIADLVLPSADWSERYSYDEELDGNFLFTFDKAVDAPGECWCDWQFFLEWGKRHRPRQLVVERRPGDGAVAYEGVLRLRSDLGRVPVRKVPLHRARRQAGRGRGEEVREGPAAPRRLAGLPDPVRPHRVLVRVARRVRLRPAARLRGAG